MERRSTPVPVGGSARVGDYRDRAFTAGLGWGYSGTDFASEPLAVLGGETRVSRRVKLIAENYILPDAVGVVLSGGLRFIGTRFATDVAVAGIAAGDEAWCCGPLVNFSYTFGRRRSARDFPYRDRPPIGGGAGTRDISIWRRTFDGREECLGTTWGWLLVLGLVLPGLIFAGSCFLVFRLARQLAALRPGGRPVWHYLVGHAGVSLVGVALPFLGALAMVVVPVHLFQERARARRAEGPQPIATLVDAQTPSRRPLGVAVFFVLSGVLLPWITGLAVKVYLNVLGVDTYPVSSFLDPVGTPIILLLTLVFWAFPFVLLASAVVIPWRVGFRPGTEEFGSLLPLWMAFGAGALVAVPVFVAVFVEFDTLMTLVPVGAVLLVPMALGYWAGWWILRRRRMPARLGPDAGGRLP